MKINHTVTFPKVLVIATNFTAEGLDERVKQGLYQRVDYLDLTEQSKGEYIDYGMIADHRLIKHFEALSRLDFRLAIKGAKLVKEKSFTTVISFSERVGIPLAPLLPKEVKHIVIQHHPLSRKRILLEKYTGVHRLWDHLITISAAEKDALPKVLSIEPDRVIAVHCPVDCSFFSPLSQNGTHTDDHIESLGLSHRDYPTLIEAMRSLPEINCHLRVGSLWTTGSADFDKHGLPENIHLQPFVEPFFLREKLAESRFIVVPIKNVTQWSTGSSTAQIAQAMGKAVIASDLPGLREYILPNTTGILVEPENPAAMAEAIRYLWENPQLAQEMGKKGREYQQKNFSIESWLDKILELL